MKVKSKQEKGITLIALVITIVVLIILATVSINMILDDNGIIGAAELAKDKYQNAAQKEKEDMYNLEEYLGENLESVGIVPTVEELQSRYEFEYYSSMAKAVGDVNAGRIGDNADRDKENAVAGIYTKEDNTYVVLLKDNVEENRIEPRANMIINLGGNKLSSAEECCIDMYSGDVTIDGRLEGSKIEMINTTEGKQAKAFQSRVGDKVTINGGTYISESNYDPSGSKFSGVIMSAVNLTIKDATIIAKDSVGGTCGLQIMLGATANIDNCKFEIDSKKYPTVAIQVDSGCTSSISNCDIKLSTEGRTNGISNSGNSTISNCNIKAYSNYDYSGDAYTSSSTGIRNEGILTINDCYVMGINSGVSNYGTLYVNGGTYEGFGHGGFYFAGTATESWVRNATIRECEMPEGYTAGSGMDNNAGFYIGGSTGNDNIKVYMDNCNIYGSSQPIVLRGSSGEKNNTLKISNSKINTDKKIRIDNNDDNGHKLYIGIGNNFTAADTTLESAVITENKSYIYEQ